MWFLEGFLYPIFYAKKEKKKLKLLHVFWPLWRLLGRAVCLWDTGLLERGPCTVIIAVFKLEVPALIKILVSQRDTMNVSLFLNWTPCPDPVFLFLVTIRCLFPACLLIRPLHTLLHSLTDIIKYSQNLKTVWCLYCQFLLFHVTAIFYILSQTSIPSLVWCFNQASNTKA